MKKIILATIVALAVAGCTSFNYEILENKKPTDVKELTVMAWNIWRGGTFAHDRDWDGRQGIVDIINHSGTDVVLMQETNGSEAFIIENTQLKYALAMANCSIFSRYPILQMKDISEWKVGMAVIDVEGTPVQLASIWIDYRPSARTRNEAGEIRSVEEILKDEEEGGTRISDMQTLLSHLEKPIEYANEFPLIVGGDFNSASHLDWTTQNAFLKEHDGLVIPWQVSTMMTDAGFTDSYRELNPFLATDTEADIRKKYGYTIGIERQRRIDYIYYQGEGIKPIKSISLYGPRKEPIEYAGKVFPQYPSDHGMVLTTFEINRL